MSKKPRGRPPKRGGGAAARGHGRGKNKPENLGKSGRRAVKYTYTDEDCAAAWLEFKK